MPSCDLQYGMMLATEARHVLLKSKKSFENEAFCVKLQSVYNRCTRLQKRLLRVQLLCVPISSILACPRISARPACTNKILGPG